MNSNTSSPEATTEPPDDLATLAAAVDRLAARDLNRLSDAALVEQVLQLRWLGDRLEGHWLQRLAAVDGRGAAGADQAIQAASTASWLRNRLHLGAAAAASAVRTARALFGGPLTKTAQALCAGEISAAHASALAHGTQRPPDPGHRRGRAGAGGGGPPPGPTPTAPRHRPPAARRRSRGGRPRH
jgi:hypothetical protein